RLRTTETNLGDLVADAMRMNTGAEAALTNAGAIRGNRIYPAGPLTRRILLSIHPFGNIVCKVEVPGSVLLQALNHGVSKLPLTAGYFPQVSGVAFDADGGAPPGARISNVTVNGEPLDAAKQYTVAVPDYLLTGGDGYDMLKGSRTIVPAESGDLLVAA